MDADEYQFSFLADLRDLDENRERSRQTALGASDFGCRTKMAFKLNGTRPTDSTPFLPAAMGTACHSMFEQARRASNPQLLLETTLSTTLPDGTVIPGHADEIDPDEPSVTDWKTSSETTMRNARKGLIGEAYQIQRQVYALGAVQAGLVPEEGLIVRNIFVAKDGKSTWVDQAPFDRRWIDVAVEKLGEARRIADGSMRPEFDAPVPICRSWCEFVSICRPELKGAA